jgi:predicted N-acetyltransferase YhbS
MTVAWKFRDACPQDAARVAELVNHAFQVERPFKNGERTDAAQVKAMLAKGRFLLMEKNDDVAACVYLEPRANHVYVGMLSVAPGLQGSGVGSQLLAEVEKQSRSAGYQALDLRFVHLRDDLSAYYSKRGFMETGTESAEGAQNFTVPVHFICMSKRL